MSERRRTDGAARREQREEVAKGGRGANSPFMPATVEHTYRYEGHSEIVTTRGLRALELSTSGPHSEHPFFFEGALTKPRLTALALRSLSKVVGSRFYAPPAMLQKILALADPVVTCSRGMLRFEGFSSCASTYVRVDLTPEAYKGEPRGLGTTNVDFNAEMRAALAVVRDGDQLHLSVGRSAVVLKSKNREVVERKVPLPTRWLKGFVEVQSFLSRMQPFCKVSGTEAMRFLRGLPRAKTSKHRYYVVSRGKSLRTSLTETSGVATTGLERLRALEDLAPLAHDLCVYGTEDGQASAWELDFGALRITVALSAEVWRGFSGEGQALTALARRETGPRLLAALRAQLAWDSALDLEGLARNVRAEEHEVADALRVLGTHGLVGYDQHSATFFHREMPFELEKLELLSPRLSAARALIAKDAVQSISGEEAMFCVRSRDVEHRVKLSANGEPLRCTCPWYAKHKTMRGPCKHMLAAQIHWESTRRDG